MARPPSKNTMYVDMRECDGRWKWYISLSGTKLPFTGEAATYQQAKAAVDASIKLNF